MKKTCFFLSLVIVFLITVSVVLYAQTVKAEDTKAIPEPIVPCLEDEYKNQEFNSQRPYQASPCGDPPKAYFCQNNYIIEEKVSRRYNSDCFESQGSYVCPVNETATKDYQIQMSNVQLPILGNTQDTVNATNPTDKIDDAQKVNEYLAWYLAGTNQKAEYGADENDKIINFSGPTKKILPSVIQELQRFKVLHDAGTQNKAGYTDSEGFKEESLDAKQGEEGVQVVETENHNQVVVCTTKNILGINNPWVGVEKPVPCNGSYTNRYRLLQWWEGKQTGYLDSFKVIEGWDGSNRWSSAVPPFPWQFEKDIYYQKAYQEWRGRECLILFDKLVCGDLKIPGVVEWHTNTWADFYSYIPLGNTTDRNAGHQIPESGSRIQPLGQTMAEKLDGEIIEQNPVLFYPHTSSTVDMLETLNQSHTPQGEGGKKKDANKAVTSSDIETSSCEVVDVRSNPGDSLTFTNGVIEDKQRVSLRNVSFRVTQIECGGNVRQWVNDCGQRQPNADLDTDPNNDKCNNMPVCSGTVQIVIPTLPKIPYGNEIWNNAVAGQNSAFRKIFPKVEEGAPVSCIADIPAVSDVDYAPVGDTNLTSLDTPGGRVSPDQAQLYFPHLGSIYEYFLKGIQTALRPQGYGEPITSGQLCPTTTASCGGWEEKLKGSGGTCGICNAPIGNLAKKILAAAGEAYNVPAANIWAAMKHEGADGYQGTTYDFSDENVRKWSNSASCGGEPMPGCNEDDPATQPPFGFLSHWFYLGEGDNALWAAVQKIDPSRNSKEKVSRCNFLDAAFAAAKLLNQGASNMTVGPSCGSYKGFNTTSPGTCSSAFWTDTKVAQSQTGYAGSCVEGPLYTIEQAVDWYHEASCN